MIISITAMSAGTMIALAADEIMMSHMSNLEPIDLQILLDSINSFIPANEIGKVMEKAQKDINEGKNRHYWQYELTRYPAALNMVSKNIIKQSNLMTKEWLKK